MAVALGRYVTGREAAEIIGVSYGRFRQLDALGRIQAIRRVGDSPKAVKLYSRRAIERFAATYQAAPGTSGGRPRKDEAEA